MEELGAQKMDTEERKDGNTEDNTMDKVQKQLALRQAFTKKFTMLADTIPAFLTDLYDVLFQNECLSENEASYITDAENDSPRNKAQQLLLMIMKRSTETMVKFLEYTKPHHNHLVETIYKSFEECKQKKEKKPICCFCFLKMSVNIKEVSELSLQHDFITQLLHEDIMDGKMTTRDKWDMFVEYFKDSEDVKKVITTIQRDYKTRGQYCELVEYLQTMRAFICECESLQDGKTKKKRYKKMMKQVFRRTERIDTEHKDSSTEVDGGYSHDERVADEHQDKRMSDTEAEQRKRLCLGKAFRLNEKVLIDNVTLLLAGLYPIPELNSNRLA